MKLKVNHPLDLPADLKEWWEVEVSWDSQSKRHLFSTAKSADDYATKRVDGLVKARASSKVYVPLATKREDDLPFCLYRVLLGPVVLSTPVWDYHVNVHHHKRA